MVYIPEAKDNSGIVTQNTLPGLQNRRTKRVEIEEKPRPASRLLAGKTVSPQTIRCRNQ